MPPHGHSRAGARPGGSGHGRPGHMMGGMMGGPVIIPGGMSSSPYGRRRPNAYGGSFLGSMIGAAIATSMAEMMGEIEEPVPYGQEAHSQTVEKRRPDNYPAKCPNCGGPTDGSEVCDYCGTRFY